MGSGMQVTLAHSGEQVKMATSATMYGFTLVWTRHAVGWTQCSSALLASSPASPTPPRWRHLYIPSWHTRDQRLTVLFSTSNVCIYIIIIYTYIQLITSITPTSTYSYNALLVHLHNTFVCILEFSFDTSHDFFKTRNFSVVYTLCYKV